MFKKTLGVNWVFYRGLLIRRVPRPRFKKIVLFRRGTRPIFRNNLFR